MINEDVWLDIVINEDVWLDIVINEDVCLIINYAISRKLSGLLLHLLLFV